MLYINKQMLQVNRAPEPTDIIWQNLSWETCDKYYARFYTNLAALILLIGSFGIIYYLSNFREEYDVHTIKLPDGIIVTTENRDRI